jgi:hypothetical protein
LDKLLITFFKDNLERKKNFRKVIVVGIDCNVILKEGKKRAQEKKEITHLKYSNQLQQ